MIYIYNEYKNRFVFFLTIIIINKGKDIKNKIIAKFCLDINDSRDNILFIYFNEGKKLTII